MRILAFTFSKKTILLHLFFLSFLTLASGQIDSTFFKKPDTRYYSIAKNTWWYEGRSLHLSPEIHYFKYLTLGLNLVEMKTISGEGNQDAKAYQLGLEYIPSNNIFAPKVAFWKGGYVYGLGGKIGINSLYYFKKDASSFAIRPMVGFGIAYFHFNYGYTFFANKKFEELSHHNFSLSWHHWILPKD